MSRAQAIAVVVLLAAGLGVWSWWRAPVAGASCLDGGVWHLNDAGIATCDDGVSLPAGQAMTMQQKFDCNTARAEELALVPGVGLALAQELVAARGSGFRSWDELDAVPGVGPARLNALQAACDIRLSDAGVW